MYGVIARLILGQLLLAPETKRRVMEALREAAKDTDNSIDDKAVDVFEAVWEIAVPSILSKK